MGNRAIDDVDGPGQQLTDDPELRGERAELHIEDMDLDGMDSRRGVLGYSGRSRKKRNAGIKRITCECGDSYD